MKRTKQIARGIGKVILALFAVVLMPILIWVALGVALNQKLRETKVQRKLAPPIGGMAKADPRHCWEVLHCPPERRETCPAHARRDIPNWVAIGLDKATDN